MPLGDSRNRRKMSGFLLGEEEVVKVQEEVIYGSGWISASQETIKLNSFSYSVPIKLNVSIHNVLVQAKHIDLLWKVSRKGHSAMRMRAGMAGYQPAGQWGRGCLSSSLPGASPALLQGAGGRKHSTWQYSYIVSSPESYLNGQNCCFSGDHARAVRGGKVKEKAATTGGLPAFCLGQHLCNSLGSQR